jgi:transposase-like protein
MPQMQLPVFPDGVTPITAELAFMKEDGRVTYFNGQMPVFVHDENDVRTFHLITSQFCINGNAKQSEIARAFGVSLISVKRAVKCYRDKGPEGFYAPRGRRGPAVLTAPVLASAQALLDEGQSVAKVAQELGLKRDTLAKAVAAGRLHKGVKKSLPKSRTRR